MKQILVILSLFFCLSANAQIFTHIRYVDKFDDTIKLEQHKTLITQDDTTFTFEEKGRKPVKYIILNEVKEGTKGSKGNSVELVNNVYGYQTTWCVVRADKYQEYLELDISYRLNPADSKLEKLMKYWLFIKHRTVTTQYAQNFIDELIWLQDELSDGKLGKDINRIIYYNK